MDIRYSECDMRREDTGNRDMIDMQRAYDVFQKYLKQFDQENEKIRLKIIHTYGVVSCVKEITFRMGLDQENCQLAELIALLHDIGRFEQIKKYDSFEPTTMDHAAFGIQLLFGEEQMIREFLSEENYDNIIYSAIKEHSDYQITEDPDQTVMLHKKLIRDADKLDNCRVKMEESISILLGIDSGQAGKLPISDRVWECCKSRKSILSSDRETRMDYWVSYLAYFYDINFEETLSIIREENYVDRIISRISYQNPDTKDKMEQLRWEIKRYMNERCEKRMET